MVKYIQTTFDLHYFYIINLNMNDARPGIGSIIRECRERKGLTQWEFAALFGKKSRITSYKWENEQISIPPEVINYVIWNDIGIFEDLVNIYKERL